MQREAPRSPGAEKGKGLSGPGKQVCAPGKGTAFILASRGPPTGILSC